MGWYKITTGSKVYVLNPERLLVRDEDGRYLTPDELLEQWRTYGTVEPLPDDVDPTQVMRETWSTPPREDA